jgi:biopolymer transport protein ExbD
MSTGGGKKGAVQSEINVTPLIDVLLVLLIIFLVMMPTLLNNEKLTVPRQIDDSTEQPDPDQIFISVKLQADQTVWNDVVSTMDVIHGLATADLKVALTVCKDELRKPTGCDKPQ